MLSRVSRIHSPNRDSPAAASPNAPSAATLVLPAAPSCLKAVLRNANLYVPQARWFQLIQDKGKEMTEMEQLTYPPDGRKVKMRKINHGLYFYSDLYQLGELVHTLLDTNHDEYFPQLPKTALRTNTIHAIGKAIASTRIFYSWSDLHIRGCHIDVMRHLKLVYRILLS